MLQSVMQFLCAFLFACLIHEYGHMMTALCQSVPVKQFGWCGLKGPFIRRSVSDSHLGEILIAAAGPLANICAAFFYQSSNPYWFRVHIILALGNLLPLKNPNSDGARILRHAKSMFLTQRRLNAIAAGIV